jgi:hypothetical protein
MATNFPEDLDSFTNPQSTDSVAIVSHSEQHSNANDAIEALEAKVGKDNSTDPASLDYRVSTLESSPADPEAIQDLAAELLDHPGHTNITVTYDDIANKLILTSESGVADSTTDDLDEGTTNLYFTNQRALDATSTAYDAAGAAATAQSNAEDYADGLAVNYDAAGAAATAQSNAEDYADNLIGDITVDGTSGNTVTDRINTAVSDLVDSAPALLDTLNELAAAIGDDENFATTINNVLATKITASSTDTLTNKTISIQSGLTYVSGYDDITGFFGQSGIVVLQDGIDKGGRIDISSEGVITQSAPGTGYTSGLAIIGGGTRIAIGTSNNTLTGKLSDFNAALLDADFATTIDITDAIQDSNDYADGLAVNYDPAGAAATAQSNAEDYADGLAVNYDPAGAAATAQSNAEDYTDTAIAGLGNDIEAGYIPITEKATAGGVASLNLSGKVPDTQLDIDEKIQDVAAQMITSGTHTNITTSYNDTTGRISLTGVPLTQEQVQDFVAPLFAHNNHVNITAVYDDNNNRIVLQGNGGGGGGATDIALIIGLS